MSSKVGFERIYQSSIVYFIPKQLIMKKLYTFLFIALNNEREDYLKVKTRLKVEQEKIQKIR